MEINSKVVTMENYTPNPQRINANKTRRNEYRKFREN